MSKPVDPATIAPQGNAYDDVTARLNTWLWLVIEDNGETRRYLVDADDAWGVDNNAYELCEDMFETPGPSATCYFTAR